MGVASKIGLRSAASPRAPVARLCTSAHSGSPVSRAPYTDGRIFKTSSRLPAMMAHNRNFVERGAFKEFEVKTDPNASRCVILTCMDSRLTHLLPAALNIKQGEAKVIKTAGAILSHPWGGIMRSVLIALYELRASEVFVVGHDDCGMLTVNPSATVQRMLASGVPEDRLRVLEAAGVDVGKWLKGFTSVEESVMTAVEAIKRHPLVPPNLKVTGLVIHPGTGELRYASGGGEESSMA
jgi:carbonic anhydrase